MKKILLFTVAVLMSVVAFAQHATFSCDAALQKNPSAFVLKGSSKAPQKAYAKDGQYMLGYYRGETCPAAKDCVGLPSYPGNYVACTYIPSYQLLPLAGGNITSVRFGIGQNIGATVLHIYAVSSENYGPELYSQEVPTTKVGWNEVTLTTPVEIPENCLGFVIGYEYQQKNTKNGQQYTSDCYPLGMDTSIEAVGGTLFYGDLGQGLGFYELAGGVLCIQAIVEGVVLDGYSAVFYSYDVPTVAVNTTATATFGILSSSSDEVKTVGYTVEYGDVKETRTATLAKSIPAGYSLGGEFDVDLVAPAKAANYKAKLTVEKMNGVDIKPISLEFDFPVLTRIVPRYSVVEEFTGTGCGWCPRGWVGMGYVKEQCSDIAGVIAFHWYNSSDPMYVSAYHNPGLNGAPGCMIDRKGETEPYYGDNDEGIIKTVKRYAQEAPEAAVTVEAVYTDDELTTIAATANTEFLTDLPGSELVFVLTGDGLTGPTSAWKQGNYYAQYASYGYTAADLGISAKNDPDIMEFFNGKYAQTSVTLVFDDVMLGSSWASSTAKNAVAKFGSTNSGSIETSTYTLKLPTKTALKPFLVKDKMYVTAMVLKADGTIANAARCHVEYPTGINTVLAPVADDAAYDLSGRKAAANAKGIQIMNGKKVIR